MRRKQYRTGVTTSWHKNQKVAGELNKKGHRIGALALRYLPKRFAQAIAYVLANGCSIVDGVLIRIVMTNQLLRLFVNVFGDHGLRVPLDFLAGH